LESRPLDVSAHWAGALMEEWSSQAQFEEELCLPTTQKSDGTPLGVAKSQIFFISFFAKPLLDLSVKAIPGTLHFCSYLFYFINQCIYQK
jgi:hypothetical protein